MADQIGWLVDYQQFGVFVDDRDHGACIIVLPCALCNLDFWRDAVSSLVYIRTKTGWYCPKAQPIIRTNADSPELPGSCDKDKCESWGVALCTDSGVFPVFCFCWR
jgi:hypothetical protein